MRSKIYLKHNTFENLRFIMIRAWIWLCMIIIDIVEILTTTNRRRFSILAIVFSFQLINNWILHFHYSYYYQWHNHFTMITASTYCINNYNTRSTFFVNTQINLFASNDISKDVICSKFSANVFSFYINIKLFDIKFSSVDNNSSTLRYTRKIN